MRIAGVVHCVILLLPFAAICTLNCRGLLQDTQISSIEWPTLEQCLGEANSESISRNTSENVWRLIKIAFAGIENIPAEVYSKMGLVLTAIPGDDIRNISMEQVEVIEAFGAIHKSNMLGGFNEAKIKIIAQKVRREWLGKNPKTYSEYDLISMGEIVCHLNVTDIEQLHAVAFKAAAERIGSIDTCPPAQLQALAKLAKRSDAFGQPKQWSKLVVSILGNIVNGLTQSDIASIDKSKLYLNRYYIQRHKPRPGSAGRTATNMTTDAFATETTTVGTSREQEPAEH